MYITRNSEEIVFDLDADEFNAIGAEAVKTILELQFSEPADVTVNIVNNANSSTTATGATSMSRALEGRYGPNAVSGNKR